MTIQKQHALLTIGDNKLCIAIQPEYEKDRGYIRFYDSSQVEGENDAALVYATETHGNGLIIEIACKLITSINNNEFSPIEDKTIISKADGLSWYNAFLVDSSLCVFRYVDTNDGKTKRAMTVIKGFDGCKNVNDFLSESIKHNTVLAFPETLEINI